MQTLFPYIKKLDPNNYRPIFLLSNISQLYEKTMGCSIFYPYKGMDDQISKNQCILQRTIVWLINPLELNLRWFDPSEKNDISEKFFHSPTLKKVTVQIYPQEKYTLRQRSLEKITIKRPPRFLRPYPCTENGIAQCISDWLSQKK